MSQAMDDLKHEHEALLHALELLDRLSQRLRHPGTQAAELRTRCTVGQHAAMAFCPGSQQAQQQHASSHGPDGRHALTVGHELHSPGQQGCLRQPYQPGKHLPHSSRARATDDARQLSMCCIDLVVGGGRRGVLHFSIFSIY